LGTGPPEAGLYVRHNGTVGRLHPDHFEWATFQRLLTEDVLVRGDEVLLEVRARKGTAEVRGTFVELSVQGLSVAVDAPDKPVTFSLRDVSSGSLRLLLASKKVLAGEEFAAMTRKGAAV